MNISVYGAAGIANEFLAMHINGRYVVSADTWRFSDESYVFSVYDRNERALTVRRVIVRARKGCVRAHMNDRASVSDDAPRCATAASA